MKSVTMILVMLSVLAAACGPLPENITIDLGEPTADVSQIVQLTFQAMTQQPAGQNSQPTATLPPPTQAAGPAATTGSVSGKLTYPAEGIPPLRVAAFNVGKNQYSYIDTQANQSTYQLDGLAPGKYHIVAYPLTQNAYPTGVYAAYTQFGLCGMHQGCNDMSLVDVVVEAGKISTGVDLVDWSVPAQNIPPMPGQPAANTQAVPSVGSITGSLTYPADAMPAMAIVAYHVGGVPNDYFYVLTQQGQTTYQIDNLPAGVYHVVAYTIGGNGFPAGLAGGYTQATLCGYQVNCNDHTLIDVSVVAGSVTPDVRPGDFYAPAGTFPAYPLP